MKDRIFNAFDQIHAEEALIEKTLEGMYSYREKKERRAFFSRRGMALVMSFALMLCVGVTGWQTYFTQAFALSVDVNPSIEMGVNRFDKVISVKGMNTEGCEIVSAVNVMHMSYEKAVDRLLEEEKSRGYLEEDGAVLVAVACPKEEKAQQVKERIDTSQAKTPQQVDVIKPKKDVVKQADVHDMSFGKYQAFLILQETHPEVTVEQAKKMSVQEIKVMLDGEISDTAPVGTSQNTAATQPGVTDDAVSGDTGNTTDNNGGAVVTAPDGSVKDPSTSLGVSSANPSQKDPAPETGLNPVKESDINNVKDDYASKDSAQSNAPAAGGQSNNTAGGKTDATDMSSEKKDAGTGAPKTDTAQVLEEKKEPASQDSSEPEADAGSSAAADIKKLVP